MSQGQGQIDPAYKPWLSLWLTIHLFALIVCLFANHSSGVLTQRLVRLLAPHSVASFQDYGAAPLAMTQALPLDDPHRIEMHRVSDPADAWQPVFAEDSILALSKPTTNFQRMLGVAGEEKNEELIHLLFEHCLRSEDKTAKNPIDGLRLVRVATKSLARFNSERQLDPSASLHKRQTIHECRVVTLPGDRPKLIPVLERTRRADTLLDSASSSSPTSEASNNEEVGK